ncbi:N-acetylmuramoyl-L-alanine amidase family protein [Croceicoccus ponticola]|nr:N-acetylmuramoyl-L-alanine amidase [Croceicoccus ponticola]
MESDGVDIGLAAGKAAGKADLRTLPRNRIMLAGAIVGGLVVGIASGLAFPGGGEAVVRRALPSPQDEGLPRIVTSGGTGDAAPLVVLDPGHGGFDPGASGENGEREKDVVLALAVDVRARLLAFGGVRVAMTREGDRFLPLEQRPALGEALGADIFVSIHADSAPTADAMGANAYVLSARASDREAQALARIENESASGIDLGNGADDVAMILADLMRRETALGSARLSRAVERESVGRMPVHQPFRRSANFVVLRSPEMASILFEAGYLTNAADAARLQDDARRAEVAEALAKAILTHLLAPKRP